MVRHTINTDWSEVILIGELFKGTPKELYKFPNEIVFQKCKGGGRRFRHKWEVIHHGQVVAIAETTPYHPEIIDPKWIKLKMLNNVLYENGWVESLETIVTSTGFPVRNFVRLDIAVDGGDFFDVFDKYDRTHEYEKKGKAGSTAYKTGKGELVGFRVGSSSSAKFVKGYNKTRELRRSRKHYIEKMWEESGLEVDGDVQRLEVTLKNEEIKKIVDFDWQRLEDPEYLASIFRTTIENFFEFVKAGGDKNISRKKVIEFIDWDALGAKLLEKSSTRETNEVYRLQLTTKSLFWIYLSTGQSHHMQLAHEIAGNINCIDWFIEKIPEWERQYATKRLDYIPHYQTYKHGEQVKLFAEDNSVRSTEY